MNEFCFAAEQEAWLPAPKKPIVCTTDGDGLWSTEDRSVTITKMKIKTGIANIRNDFTVSMLVEIDAYFNKRDWNVDKHGLIYTDPRWIKEFNTQFKQHYPGITSRFIDYTESGMQGDNYVSLEFECKNQRDMKKMHDAISKYKNIQFEWTKY